MIWKCFISSVLVWLLCSLAGCASVLSGKSQKVTLDKTKHGIDVVCKKEGFTEAKSFAESGTEGSVFANLLVGGVLGWAIDSSAGADNKYPDVVTVELVPTNVKVEKNEVSPKHRELTPSRGTKHKPEPQPVYTGTAWVVQGGHVVTCYHVVANAKELTLVKRSGETIPARILVSDPVNDIAILATDAPEKLPPALMLSSSASGIGAAGLQSDILIPT